MGRIIRDPDRDENTNPVLVPVHFFEIRAALQSLPQPAGNITAT